MKHNSVERFRQVVLEIRSQPTNITTLDVIARVFGIDGSRRQEFYEQYSAFLELADEAVFIVQQLPSANNEVHYLQFVRKIRNVFHDANLFAPWENYRNQIDDLSVHVLMICADQAYSLGSVDKEVDSDEVISILEDLQSLVITIADSDLPYKLKIGLICLLEEVREKLLSYKISGPEGLSNVVLKAEGYLLANQQEIVEHMQEEKSSATLKSFWKFVTNLNALLSTGKHIKELAPPVAKFLQEFFN